MKHIRYSVWHSIMSCIVLFVSPTLCDAQVKTHLSIEGTSYYIPKFISDSSRTYDNWFVQNHIVSNIKESNSELEIRSYFKPGYFSMPEEGDCLIIKGTKDSLTADFYWLYSRFKGPRYGGVVFLKDKRRSEADIMLKVYHITAHAKLDSILKKLLSNHITNQIDYDALLVNLKKRNIRLVDPLGNDCCAPRVYEVKIGSQFKNFTTNPYFYQAQQNHTVEELVSADKLDMLIWNLEQPLRVQ